MARFNVSVAVFLLVAALACAWCAADRQARESRIWVEAYAQPRAVCYQGPPLRELAHLTLWRGGPGVKLMQERRGLALVPSQ